MFGRRRRSSPGARLRDFLWPRAGWRRVGLYVGHRVRRLPGSPHSIALGLAWGVAVSFTPLVGFHFVLAAVLAWATGGNVLASALGTAVGNPWTFPVIWFAAYHAGSWILGGDGAAPGVFTMSSIFDNPQSVLLPMMVGGVPMGAGAWLISFWLVRRAVARYQHMRRARIERRQRTPPAGPSLPEPAANPAADRPQGPNR